MKLLKILIPLVPLYLIAQPLEEFRAVKITNVDSEVMFSNRNIENAMDYLASIGINTILAVVWNGNGADGDYTLYPSNVMQQYFGEQALIHPASQWEKRDPLQQILLNAHRNGMEVLPWFEMGFATSYLQNGGHILKEYPYWALENINGELVVENGFDWMSAINPEVQDFIRELTLEVAQNYDVDGIEYSDRIPAMPVKGGYDSTTVAIYRSEHNGQSPPADCTEQSWMQWRADKLSRFYREIKDSLKYIDENLLVSSSPSLYSWSYEHYLQDSKTWVDSGIVDNIIPQVYHPQNLNEYEYELNKALSYIPQQKKDILFSGMLIKSGSYVISKENMLSFMQANRNFGVYGEAFFFYEGLRDNNNELGETLKSSFYSSPAIPPGRQSKIWRPKGIVVNENDPGNQQSGSWVTENSIQGFRDGILINTSTERTSLEYVADIPYNGWFDVFIYMITGPKAAPRALYTVYADDDSLFYEIDQSDLSRKGFQPLSQVYLQKGRQKILKLDNRYLQSGQVLTADAVLLLLNRRLSPDVVVTDLAQSGTSIGQPLTEFRLQQNYPNPFNSSTRIPFYISRAARVELAVYDLLGRKIVEQKKSCPAGQHTFTVNASRYSSGVYLYHITVYDYSGNVQPGSKVRKMLLVK